MGNRAISNRLIVGSHYKPYVPDNPSKSSQTAYRYPSPQEQKPIEHIEDTPKETEFDVAYFKRKITKTFVPKSIVNTSEEEFKKNKGNILYQPPHVPRPRWFDDQEEFVKLYEQRFGPDVVLAGVPPTFVYREHTNGQGKPTGLPIMMCDIRAKKTLKSE